MNYKKYVKAFHQQLTSSNLRENQFRLINDLTHTFVSNYVEEKEILKKKLESIRNSQIQKGKTSKVLNKKIIFFQDLP